MWQPRSQAFAAATPAVGTWPRATARSQAISIYHCKNRGRPVSSSPSILTGDILRVLLACAVGRNAPRAGVEEEMKLGLHDLFCATGLRLLRSLKSCGQASFNRSTTYARSTSYGVILVLHASSTFALPPSAQVFQADSSIELTPSPLEDGDGDGYGVWWLPHARPQDSTLVSIYRWFREFV